MNADDEVVADDVFQKKQKHGLNLNELDVSNDVNPGEIYLLECRNSLNETMGFRFMIREEDDENTIDNLNLDQIENTNTEQIIK